MKNSTQLVKLAAAAFFALTIIVLFIRNDRDADSLALRIKSYESRADSLRQAVREIDESIHQKDSILLLYLASLDKTLEELNKEEAKNKKSIQVNFIKQDSVRKAYCLEMASLDQHPDDCQ